jgi:formylglycine-generating enzyme required for sulfatase activity
VTFDEWDNCYALGGCKNMPDDAGRGRGNRPVVNVHRGDAQEYVLWLSRQTGKNYRLLSEAEWEYAARAGSTTAYYWGDEVGTGNANCTGCGSEWNQTSPVGSFKPNAFGLHDMAGNAWQWVQDCAHDDYIGAPTDGSPWMDDICHSSVVRGGSWFDGPQIIRAANRFWGPPNFRLSTLSFRVARTLRP